MLADLDRSTVERGDDLADEAAIASVGRMGGHGLHTARAFGNRPARVREWLKSFVALDSGVSQ